ncbi:MAG TPA: hypothetical protein VGF79_01625, partial [Bacteroidia bacterium]
FGMANGCFGVALTNNIGVYSSLGVHYGDNDIWPLHPVFRIKTKVSHNTLGLGLYRNVGRSNGNRLECFAEISRGAFDVDGSSDEYIGTTRVYYYSNIDGRYNQYSLLLNNSIKTQSTQVVFSFKLGATHFYDYMEADDDPIYLVMEKLKKDKYFYSGDFALSVIFGKRDLKLKYQYLLNYGLSKISEEEKTINWNMYVCMGLVFSPRYY